MSVEETAAAIGISPRTVKRDWTLAQAWLQREMQTRSDAMESEKHDHLSELFERAVELSPDARGHFLDVCSDDPAIRAELRSLLAAHDRAPNLLEHLAAEVLPAALDAVASDGPPQPTPGRRRPAVAPCRCRLVGASVVPDTGAHRCRRHRHRLSRVRYRAAAPGCDQDTRLERAGCARVAPARGPCGVGLRIIHTSARSMKSASTMACHSSRWSTSTAARCAS